MISISNHKKQVPFQLYKLKKKKQPDHLLSMIQKFKKQKQNINLAQNDSLDSKVKQAIRKHMIEKHVNNIMTVNQKKSKINPPQISQPIKCVQKTWMPPIEKQVLSKKFNQQQLLIQAEKKKQYQKRQQSQRYQLNNMIKTINLNKKIKYFGDFLSSQYDHQSGMRSSTSKTLSLSSIPKTKQSKMIYLENKFKLLKAKSKPKLFLLNSPQQNQKYFYNPLSNDQYFSTIMRQKDQQLMKILIKSLQQQQHFSLTSFTKFYDIFVWQNASKIDLIKFTTKILMGNNSELPIIKISQKIDEICEKINLQELNHSLQNFSEIMKKLLFGEEFVFALKNQYFLTRKALMESLSRNEECISIFVNVFYV